MWLELIRKSIEIKFRPKDLNKGFSTIFLQNIGQSTPSIFKGYTFSYEGDGYFKISNSLTDTDVTRYQKDLNLSDIDKIKAFIIGLSDLELEFKIEVFGFDTHKELDTCEDVDMLSQKQIEELLTGRAE